MESCDELFGYVTIFKRSLPLAVSNIDRWHVSCWATLADLFNVRYTIEIFLHDVNNINCSTLYRRRMVVIVVFKKSVRF